jgi:alpha-glucosidase (family GH31 glycosyl hydrolase)
LTGAGEVALSVLDGPDLRAVWTAYVRQVGWPPEVPPLFDVPIIYTATGADPAAIAQHGFPTGGLAPAGIPAAGADDAPDLVAAPAAVWGQGAAMALRLPDLLATWDAGNGLGALPGQVLTAALLGYPFVVPGTIGGRPSGSRRATSELLVRWTQAAAFTLSMVFDTVPWGFLAPTPGICRAYTWLHLALKPWLLDYAGRVTCANGYPPLRPLGLDYPTDSQALAAADQWLLGDRVLVAPVLAPPRGREIYLPAGRWFDPWSNGYVEGPKRLEVRVPLHICPFFILTDEDQEPWAAFPAAEALVAQIKRMG